MIFIHVTDETYIKVSEGKKRDFPFWNKSIVLMNELSENHGSKKINVSVIVDFKKGSRGIDFECSLREVNNTVIVHLDKPFLMWADIEGKPKVERDAIPLLDYFI